MYFNFAGLTGILLSLLPSVGMAEVIGQIEAEEQCREEIASREDALVAETVTITNDAIELDWGDGAVAAISTYTRDGIHLTPEGATAIMAILVEGIEGRRVLGARLGGDHYLVRTTLPSADGQSITCGLIPLH